MRTIGTKQLGMAAALAVALATAFQPLARAQDTDPGTAKTVAVVSLTSYNELLKDIRFVGKLVDKPGLAEMLEGSVMLFTQGQGLAGLDKGRPIGVVAQAKGDQITPLGFVPVTDLKQLVGVFGALTGGPIEPNDEDVYEIEGQQQTVFLKEKDGWAFISRSADDLKNLPADPVKLLGGLEKEYDLAVRVHVQNIPDAQREMAVAQLQQGMAQGLDRLPDEDEEQYQLRKQIAENSMKNLVSLINETDHVTIGWKIDTEAESTHLDVAVVAVPDSKLARQAAMLSEAKSDFAGFLADDAAVRVHLTTQTGTEEDVAQALAVIDAARTRAEETIDKDEQLPDDEARATLKSVVGDVTEVLKATIKEGKMDGGLLLKLGADGITIAGGGRVADGPKLEAAFKKLAELAEKEPEFPGVKWDAEKHDGVRFHTTRVPVKEEDAKKYLGEELDVVLGVGAKSIYVGLGKDSLATIKGVIDRSKTQKDEVVPPMQVVISVGQIVKFAAEQEDDPNLDAAADALAETEGKDNVRVTVQAVTNGVRYRVEAEQGVLKAIGRAGSAANQGGEPALR